MHVELNRQELKDLAKMLNYAWENSAGLMRAAPAEANVEQKSREGSLK